MTFLNKYRPVIFLLYLATRFFVSYEVDVMGGVLKLKMCRVRRREALADEKVNLLLLCCRYGAWLRWRPAVYRKIKYSRHAGFDFDFDFYFLPRKRPIDRSTDRPYVFTSTKGNRYCTTSTLTYLHLNCFCILIAASQHLFPMAIL